MINNSLNFLVRELNTKIFGVQVRIWKPSDMKIERSSLFKLKHAEKFAFFQVHTSSR